MAPVQIPLFPLTNGLFPDGLLSLNIFEVRYLKMVTTCFEAKLPFGVVMLDQGNEVQKAGVIETLHDWGCLANIISVQTIQPAVLYVKCKGGARFELGERARGQFGLWQGMANLSADDARAPIPSDLQYLADKLGALIASAQKRGAAEELPLAPPYRLDECGWVANRWAELLPLPPIEKVALLAEDDPQARLYKISDWI